MSHPTSRWQRLAAGTGAFALMLTGSLALVSMANAAQGTDGTAPVTTQKAPLEPSLSTSQLTVKGRQETVPTTATRATVWLASPSRSISWAKKSTVRARPSIFARAPHGMPSLLGRHQPISMQSKPPGSAWSKKRLPRLPMPQATRLSVAFHWICITSKRQVPQISSSAPLHRSM